MSTPTPDYGEPWRVDSANGVMDKNDNAICYPFGTKSMEALFAERIKDCCNAFTGVQDPAAHLANLNATIEQQAETLKVMNDALKEAHRIFGNLSHSQVVQRLCPDFAEVAELVRKSHDQHA
jgi:hypothetical protein